MVVVTTVVVVFVRLRGQVPAVVARHRWLASLGVPAPVRHLDATLLLLATAFAGAAWLSGRGLRGACATLGLVGPVLPSLRFAALAAVPMAVAGALVGDDVHAGLELVPAVLVAPLVEEVVYRGLLVAAIHRAGGVRFLPAVILSSLLFGAGHVTWSRAPGVGEVAVVLVTGIGGAWFAWLLRARGWILADTIALHAAMNLAWALFGVAENAVGGLAANLGRAATVAFTVVVTLRRARGEERPAARPRPGLASPPPPPPLLPIDAPP